MEISKRKLFASLFVIGLVALLTGAGTYSWLSDTETVPWTLEVKTADLEVEPEDLTFPKAAPGESVSADITVTNVGEVTLIVTITASGDWVTFTLPEDFTLDPGAEKTVTITITVSGDYTESGGSLSGTITVSGEQTHP